MERISKYQLAAIIILHEIGSASLFYLGGEAKQDSWIAIFIAMIVGLVILAFITLTIHSKEPDKNLIELITSYFGKYLGAIISIVYILYFTYSSTRNVREFGDIILLTLLPDTPISMVMLVLVIISTYAVYKGIETFFRIGEFILPFFLFIYFVIFILFFSSGFLNFEYMLPVLENGIFTVMEAGIPKVLSFPFSEMFMFLMYFKYFEDKKGIKKITISTYLFSGFFIIWMNIMILAALGPLSTMNIVPLLSSIRLIEIGGIIERMDPLFVLVLFISVFIKQTAYYLAAVLALSQLIKKEYKKVILPIGALIFVGAFLEKNFTLQIWFGIEYITVYVMPFVYILIPVLLLVVIYVKGFLNKKPKKG
ncbi:GerAB/ArcD/ProY family transporter [Metabacillus halosaccharovorans]|uniref:GerAB/ArcD/ProY family transporter n=1 Tax=Metabacillus halosaccharovorans TaxID=930124 RepID=UPI0034CE26A0